MSLLENFAKAIEDGDSTLVESLLASGLIDVNARLPRLFNPPPLVFAVRCCGARRVDIVEMLLSANAFVDGVDDNEQTACFAATVARNVAVLAVLLARQPNLEIKDNRYNQNPLRLSLDYKVDYIAVMLINAGAAVDDFAGQLCALASRSTAAIQALRNRGVVLSQLRDTGNSNGNRNLTPLHAVASTSIATVDDVEAVVKMLVGCGVDLEARTSDGETCTHVAAVAGNEAALRCFINAGADMNSANLDERTPLHLVSDYKCTVLLLAAGADLNKRDSVHRTNSIAQLSKLAVWYEC
jgi:ankyrin repeat protein